MNTKPRLLFILNRFVVGGHIFDTIPLAYHLQKDFDILILYGTKKHDEIEAFYLLDTYPGLKIKEIKWLKRSVNPINDLLAFVSISKEIRKFKPAIVHTHGAKPGLLGRIAAYVAGSSAIIHTFHGHFFHSYYGAFVSKAIVLLERVLAKTSTYIIATSKQQWMDLVVRYKIASPDKVKIIHLGIEEAFYTGDHSADRNVFREKFDLKSKVAIGIIARITEVKNFGLFARVVERVAKRSEVKFFVIGDGALKGSVQKDLTEKGVRWCSLPGVDASAQVVFTSWIADVAKVLPGLDIVVLTSNNEGTGLSLVEAQLFGKPVVATKVGGVEDTLINGTTGYFALPDNADDFSEKLLQLISNQELRNSMGENAATFAKHKFSKIAEIDNCKSLYLHCLNQTPH